MSRKVLISLPILFALLAVSVVLAETQHNLSGWAWSENIGWISFNCTNEATCDASDYRVNVDSSGNVSGYAWASNIGWVSFNSNDVSGCPAGTCEPKMNQSNGEVSGWARVLSALADGTDDGWDGWISLNCSNNGTCGTSDYKVKVEGSTWGGWAWGSSVVGWISFNSESVTGGGGAGGGAGGSWGVSGSGNATFLPPSPLNIACSASQETNTLKVTWSADFVSGGESPYSYSWSGDVSDSTQNVIVTYSSGDVGTEKNAIVRVTDNGGQFQDCPASIIIQGPPSPPSPGIIEIIP